LPSGITERIALAKTLGEFIFQVQQLGNKQTS
jgi:hypothetical protein